MKKVLSFIIVIAMFLLVSAVDTVDNTSEKNIVDAQIQAQINMKSRGR